MDRLTRADYLKGLITEYEAFNMDDLGNRTGVQTLTVWGNLGVKLKCHVLLLKKGTLILNYLFKGDLEMKSAGRCKCSIAFRRFVLFICICNMWIQCGCHVNPCSNKNSFDSPVFQAEAEAKALSIANCEVIKYKVIRSRYYPQYWIVNYKSAEEQEAHVTLDLYGNLVNTSVMENHSQKSSTPEKKNACREISRAEALKLASDYISVDQTAFVYVDYCLARWEVVLELIEKPDGIAAWKSVNEISFVIAIWEDGSIFCPEHIKYGDSAREQ